MNWQLSNGCDLWICQESNHKESVVKFKIFFDFRSDASLLITSTKNLELSVASCETRHIDKSNKHGLNLRLAHSSILRTRGRDCDTRHFVCFKVVFEYPRLATCDISQKIQSFLTKKSCHFPGGQRLID